MKSEIYVQGYRLIYLPEHPRALKGRNEGYVYEHVVVATKAIGRPLRPNEVVHHLDGSRDNNVRSNLIVLERSEHARLHRWLQGGGPVRKPTGVQGKNSGKPVSSPFCVICGLTLQDKQQKTCSEKCHLERVGTASKIPPKETLELLCASHSREAIGRMYGVTGNAVKKWMRKYGMAIPSRAKDTSLEGVETSGGVESP